MNTSPPRNRWYTPTLLVLHPNPSLVCRSVFLHLNSLSRLAFCPTFKPLSLYRLPVPFSSYTSTRLCRSYNLTPQCAVLHPKPSTVSHPNPVGPTPQPLSRIPVSLPTPQPSSLLVLHSNHRLCKSYTPTLVSVSPTPQLPLLVLHPNPRLCPSYTPTPDDSPTLFTPTLQASFVFRSVLHPNSLARLSVCPTPQISLSTFGLSYTPTSLSHLPVRLSSSYTPTSHPNSNRHPPTTKHQTPYPKRNRSYIWKLITLWCGVWCLVS